MGTNNRIKCRHHNSNDTSTIYWDCPKMIEDFQVYLTQNYIEKIHEIIHPVLGVVTSNIAERVGMVALTFRDKETYLGPEHYGLSTNMAPLHINEIGFRVIRDKLKQLGKEDAMLNGFRHWKAHLFKLIG